MDIAAIKQKQIDLLIDTNVIVKGSPVEAQVSHAMDQIIAAINSRYEDVRAASVVEAVQADHVHQTLDDQPINSPHFVGVDSGYVPASDIESVASKENYKGYAVFTVTSSPDDKYKVVKENALPEDEAHYFNTVADAEEFIDSQVA